MLANIVYTFCSSVCTLPPNEMIEKVKWFRSSKISVSINMTAVCKYTFLKVH